jgi:hypothetical protein
MDITVIPGEKLVIRLWETIADKGIGSLLRPWRELREDQAALELRRQELVELTNVQRRISQSDAEPTSDGAGAQSETTRAVSELSTVAIAMRNLKVEAVRKEIALAYAVARAEQALMADESEPSTNAVSDHWLLRWRECAAGASSGELHTIWGRVLAAQVKAPEPFSLRGLEFINNLTPVEVRAIDKLSPFAVENFILHNAKGLDGAGVNMDVLSEMQNIGVLTGVQPSAMTAKIRSMTTERFYCALRCSGNTMLAVIADDAAKTCMLTVHFISGIGRQIMNLCGAKPNEEMLATLIGEIKQQGFKVQRGKFKLVRPDTAEFYDLIEP